MERLGGNIEGFNLGSIVAHIKADTSQFTAGLNEAKGQADGFASSLQKIAPMAAAVVDAIVIGFGVKSIKAFSEAQATTAQLSQVLQTTGKNATLTTDQVHKLAMSLEEYSGQTHDAIEKGQTILLQFSGITAKTLPEASKAMVDLSQRMGVDTVTAAKSLGIALDDPEVGMSRLRRSGIDFTDSQKAAIKALKESGDTAGAAALLMQVLETKVGGAAGAYRNTLSGAVAEAKAKITDFEDTVGGKLVNALQAAYTWYEKHKRIINDVVGVVGTFVGVVAALLVLYGNWILLTKALAAAQTIINILFLTNPIIAAITAIVIIAALIYEHWNKIKEVLRPVFEFFDKYINPVIDKLAKLIKEQLIKAWDDLKDSFEKIMKTLKPFEPQLKLIGEIIGIALITPLALLAVTIGVAIAAIVAIGVFLARLVGWISEVVAAVINWEVKFVESVARVVASITSDGTKIVQWFVDLPGKIMSIFSGAIGWLWNAGNNIIQGLINGILSLAGGVWNAVKSVADQIGRFFGGAGSWLYDAGRAIIQGLINGVTDMAEHARNAISDITNGIKDTAKKILGIFSPSKVFHEIGLNVGRGLINGINSMQDSITQASGNMAVAAIAPAASTINNASSTSNITTSINGPINIGNNADATRFLKQLTQNQELAMKGLTPVH